jgi:hypothetical protein
MRRGDPSFLIVVVCGLSISHFPDTNRTPPRYETYRPANWRTPSIPPGKYGEIGFTRRNFSLVSRMVSIERDEEKRKPVLRRIPLYALRIDHFHDFGLSQFKIIVI